MLFSPHVCLQFGKIIRHSKIRLKVLRLLIHFGQLRSGLETVELPVTTITTAPTLFVASASQMKLVPKELADMEKHVVLPVT